MAEIDDFNLTVDAQFEDFMGGDGGSVTITPTPSNRNLSVFAAALDPSGNIEQTFNSVNSELEASGSSITSSNIIGGLIQEGSKNTTSHLIEVLSDPKIKINNKKAVIDNFWDTQTKLWSTRNLISTQAASEDSPGETKESSDQRIDVAAIMSEVNDYLAAEEFVLNQSIAKNDSNLYQDIANFAELITPFVEQSKVAQIANEFNRAVLGGKNTASVVGKTLLFLGDAKEDIRTALKFMPNEERLRAVQSLANIINSHKGIILTDDNDLIRVDMLRTFLEDGYYDDIDQFIDNTISLLDASILGGVAAKSIAKFRRATLPEVRTLTSDEMNVLSKNVSILEESGLAEKYGINETQFRFLNDEELTELSKKQFTKEEIKELEENIPNFSEATKGDFSSSVRFQTPQEIEKRTGIKFTPEEVAEFPIRNLESLGNKKIVVGAAKPTSLANNYKNVNPDKARALHHVADADQTGEFSEAVYGVNRTDALVNDVVPQVGSMDSSIQHKVGRIDKKVVEPESPSADLVDFIKKDGNIHYSPAEKNKARARVATDFENALGLNFKSEMSDIINTDSSIKIGAVYGPVEGGFRSAKDARDLAKYALKDYGITDKNITLLQRNGDRYVPVTGNADKTGDFLIRIDHEYKFNASKDVVDTTDIGYFDPLGFFGIKTNLKIKRNLFDYFPRLVSQNVGSLNSHLIDAQSVLSSLLTNSASVAVDKAVGLERVLVSLTKEFGDAYSSLSKERRTIVDTFIKQANKEGLEYSYSNLKAAGLVDSEITMLNQWKQIWDNIYFLENQDLKRTLSNRGFKVFVDKGTNTQLFARPIHRTRAGGITKYYDPVSDEIKVLSEAEKKSLYDNGGTLAKLKSPVTVSDDIVDVIISSEKSDGTYLRAFTEDDKVLHYRPGYYQVHYKDPIFIRKKVMDRKGNILYEKAVATTGSIEEAKLVKNRLNSVNEETNTKYFFTPDRKNNFSIRDDEYFDLAMSHGRTAQKVRGKRLEDASANITDLSHNNIVDPAESLTRAIRNISRRVSMRDWLETSKARFMKQFDEIIPRKKGQPVPFDTLNRTSFNNVDDLELRHMVADARTTFDYIRAMESGYVNAIDDTYKIGLNFLAEAAGDLKMSKIEAGLRGLSEANPTGISKGAAFKMYLALNPARQFVVQSHQAVRLSIISPKYMANPNGMLADLQIIEAGMRDVPISQGLLKRTGRTLEEANEMISAYKRSGLFAAVDANNLVRGDLRKIADVTIADRTKRALNAPINLSQRVGFDLGEHLNITTAWLAFRDEALKSGAKLSPAVYDEIHARARSFTFGMNQANDMPYNSNYLNILFQFFQVPHKAFLQYTNKTLPLSVRRRALAFDTVMFGLPVGTGSMIYNWATQGQDPADENKFVRDSLVNGMETAILNALITSATGDKSAIDFSSLAPGNLTGIYDLIHETWTSDISTIIANTPSGQLLFGGNPRLTNMFKTTARYFNLIDDYENPTTLMNVAKSFAELSSGYSNFFKAKMAFEYQKKFNALGEVTADATPVESFFQLFGFRNEQEARNFLIADEIYEKSNAKEKDFKKWYKDLAIKLRQDGLKTTDYDWITRVQSEAFRAFKNESLKVRDWVNKELNRAMRDKNDILYRSLKNHLDLNTVDDVERMVRNSGMPDEYKRNLLSAVETIRGFNK